MGVATVNTVPRALDYYDKFRAGGGFHTNYEVAHLSSRHYHHGVVAITACSRCFARNP